MGADWWKNAGGKNMLTIWNNMKHMTSSSAKFGIQVIFQHQTVGFFSIKHRDPITPFRITSRATDSKSKVLSIALRGLGVSECGWFQPHPSRNWQHRLILICGQEPHASSEFPPLSQWSLFFAGSIPICLGVVLSKLPHLAKKTLKQYQTIWPLCSSR